MKKFLVKLAYAVTILLILTAATIYMMFYHPEYAASFMIWSAFLTVVFVKIIEYKNRWNKMWKYFFGE